MKQTRMRMSKEAALLIHDWRDAHEHETNSDAIHELFADYWATESKVMHLEGFKSRYDEMRFRYQANAHALVDSQKMLHEKDAHIKRINSELSRGRHLCDELQKYVRRLKKENYSLAEEIYNKPSSKPSLLWRILAFMGCWSPLFIYAAFEAGSALS